MITDYSSVFFDYAMLNRPILFYMYDLMEYKKGSILEAETYLIDSETMWDVASKKMREDAYYFTDEYVTIN